MKRNNFTVTEIIIAAIILALFVTIAIPVYNSTVENAKARSCELNLKTILGAVEAQTLERDSFPASLSKISDKNFEKAWAKVLKEEGALSVKLTYFLVNLDEKGLAYAAVNNQPWIHKFITNNATLTCPSSRGGNSYGVNSALAGRTYEEYKNLPNITLVVGDCDANRFGGAGELASRHVDYMLFHQTNYALTVDKGRKKIKIPQGGGSPTQGLPALRGPGGEETPAQGTPTQGTPQMRGAPGQTGSTPGQSGNNPGHTGSIPGQTGTTPGQSGNNPGQSSHPFQGSGEHSSHHE